MNKLELIERPALFAQIKEYKKYTSEDIREIANLMDIYNISYIEVNAIEDYGSARLRSYEYIMETEEQAIVREKEKQKANERIAQGRISRLKEEARILGFKLEVVQ